MANSQEILSVSHLSNGKSSPKDCQIRGFYENGKLVIDTRRQNHHQRLGIGTKIPLSWGKEGTI